MSKVRISLIVSLMVALFLAGCAKEEQMSPATEPVCGVNVKKAEAMKAAEDVLGELHFVINKSDAEAGVVKTWPLSGGQFFEVWRRDNVGFTNWAESSLQTIRRTVQIDISMEKESLCVGCNVRVQRLNMPERESSDPLRPAGMFSKSTETNQRGTIDTAQRAKIAWNDLGRDGRLEAEILKRIEKKVGVQDGGKGL